MSILKYLAGPLIGSIIGYCTNYIAVKMLFRPLKPVKIGNWTLPFTPGIIPKGKKRLAKALGSAVGTHLLTSEDFETMLLSKKVQDAVADRISEGIQKVQTSDDTVEVFFKHYVEEEDYAKIRTQLEGYITGKIISGLNQMDVGTIIAEEGAKEVKARFAGSMVGMFLNDELISSIAKPIGDKVGEYIRDNGEDRIYPIVVGEVAVVENKPIQELLASVPLGERRIKEIVREIYVKFVREKAGDIAGKFDVAGIVERKVNEMDVLEVEEILLSIMKKELNAVINLGALIGFVIGLLNLLL